MTLATRSRVARDRPGADAVRGPAGRRHPGAAVRRRVLRRGHGVNSAQYAVDRAAAVGELARDCRRAARVAIGVWGDPARCETEGLFARLRSLAPPPPGTPASLALSDAGVVEELLAKAGLTVRDGADVPIPITFASLDDAWHAHISASPLQKVLSIAGEDASGASSTTS